MAFIIFFSFLKKFEEVEKTGFFRAKFFLHCTLSLILGIAIISNAPLDLSSTYLSKEHLLVVLDKILFCVVWWMNITHLKNIFWVRFSRIRCLLKKVGLSLFI